MIWKSAMFEMSKSDIESAPFLTKEGRSPFYRFLGTYLAGDWDNVEVLDCRHISVSKDIGDAWREYAEKSGVDMEWYGQTLVLSGPKIEPWLPERTVLVDDCGIVPKNGAFLPPTALPNINKESIARCAVSLNELVQYLNRDR